MDSHYVVWDNPLLDSDTACRYCIEAIKADPHDLLPLYIASHKIRKESKNIEEFRERAERLLSSTGVGFIISADIFYMEKDYKAAVDYIEKYERENHLSQSHMLLKIKCLIRQGSIDECLKYTCYIPVNSLYYFQSFKHKLLCFILKSNYETVLSLIHQISAAPLLDYRKWGHSIDEGKNTKMAPSIKRKVIDMYEQFLNLLTGSSTTILSEDENDKSYTLPILEICDILLVNKEFGKLEKALNIFNLISDKSVLIQLGKLYYRHGYNDLAKNEIIRSIKLFDAIDREALEILKDCIPYKSNQNGCDLRLYM